MRSEGFHDGKVFLTFTSASVLTSRSLDVRRLGQYEQHDLVQLVDCVGVIVECGADTAKVLTSGGRPDRPEIRTVRLPDIKKRAGSRNAVTNDLSLQPVRFPSATSHFHPPYPLPLPLPLNPGTPSRAGRHIEVLLRAGVSIREHVPRPTF